MVSKELNSSSLQSKKLFTFRFILLIFHFKIIFHIFTIFDLYIFSFKHLSFTINKRGNYYRQHHDSNIIIDNLVKIIDNPCPQINYYRQPIPPNYYYRQPIFLLTIPVMSQMSKWSSVRQKLLFKKIYRISK